MHLPLANSYAIAGLFMKFASLPIVAHLFRPLQGGSAAVIFVFTILLCMAFYAGIFGIPLGFIVISWFFKYSYVLFDHAARGFAEPPVLDIQMMNPLNEQRPVGQVVIATATVALVYAIDQKAGLVPAVIIGAIAGLLLPASVAVLGVEGNLLKAANPVAWLRIALAFGPLYALILAIIAAYFLLEVLVIRSGLWIGLQILIAMFFTLSVFSVLGGLVYERRDELGIEAWASPERNEGIRLQSELRESERQVAEAYGKARSGSHLEAWQILQTWLANRGYAPDDYRWLCSRADSWNDPRYITRLTEEWLERLLALRRNGEALDVAGEQLASDPSFRPRTAASTLQIARLAAVGGGTKKLARILLADFSARYPGDQLVASAAALAQAIDP